ncbi:MAG: TetR/AcrR family transcriptional regulator [Solirubrobacteraceae bacterium]
MRTSPDLSSPVRLPSGRHGLTREDVAGSQRGRILAAMMSAAREKGYAVATVGDIVERAGVSRRTFYEHFADKPDCFLAAYTAGTEVLLAGMREAVRAVDQANWRVWARASVESYLELLEAEPDFAWALHVEVFAAGPTAQARRAEIVSLLAGRWRRLYDRALREDPGLGPAPSESLLRTIVVGHEELVREQLRNHHPPRLRELTGAAVEIALRMLDPGAGVGAAAAVVDLSQDPSSTPAD